MWIYVGTTRARVNCAWQNVRAISEERNEKEEAKKEMREEEKEML